MAAARLRRNLRRWILLACLLPAAGCRTYVLQGRVIEGVTSDMTFVPLDDPRLGGAGVANVRITVDRDPDRLSRHMVGTDLSRPRGGFSIPIGEFGAGWMDETWLIRASKPGYRTASAQLRLADDREMRLLIIMAPGVSETPRDDADWFETLERYK